MSANRRGASGDAGTSAAAPPAPDAPRTTYAPPRRSAARGNPASMDPRAEAVADRRSRGALLAMTVAGMVFFAIGAYAWRAERQRLATFRPVPAVVLGTDVIASHGGDDDGTPTFRPVVRYRYEVAGRGAFVGDRVTPLGESRSGGWARTIVGRYAPRMAVTAYVNPDDPSQSFLERRRSPLPWAFMGFASVVLALVGLVGAQVRRR